ncbi:RNA polymerase sigma factor SigK [Glutamicibacter uratoxydans]|uniref:RNA polymerase sigma factor SigK n=1 Tax=Glutamicibacter uratoxydans TaxID=43667 RepID=A0A4Y4DQZ3_GLUUR|nr:ECF RNA polymerase sigma factor SigK [Glutamicibacter uratoxydans]GED04921.1 RNA polymerase sigma factor SigK [Glutamicibacter uratoxydans]
MIPNRSSEPIAGSTTAEDLLIQVAQGQAEAFAQLYDLLAPRVYGLVRRLLRDEAQSEEVTQEIFVEAWQYAARFDPHRSSAATWLLTIAHRRAVDRIRSSQASRDRDLKIGMQNFQASYEGVEEHIVLLDESHRMIKAMGELSEAQRDAIHLAYFNGLTHVEIADHLKLPVGTVKTRIRDGMKKLRDLMGVA